VFDRIKGTQKNEGIFDGIKGIKNKIDYYKNYPHRDEIIRATWELIKALCKKIIPKKLQLTGEVGLDLPHNTAYLFAFTGSLCLPISGIKPNFDEQTMNLKLYARGKIRLWSILWPLFRFAIKRPIWLIIKKFIRKGDVK